MIRPAKWTTGSNRSRVEADIDRPARSVAGCGERGEHSGATSWRSLAWRGECKPVGARQKSAGGLDTDDLQRAHIRIDPHHSGRWAKHHDLRRRARWHRPDQRERLPHRHSGSPKGLRDALSQGDRFSPRMDTRLLTVKQSWPAGSFFTAPVGNTGCGLVERVLLPKPIRTDPMTDRELSVILS